MIKPRPGGRTAKKRRDILAAAQEAFLESGYEGASMDSIAAAANVSKPTIYKHFNDKDKLFAAAIVAEIAAAESKTAALIQALPTSKNLEHDLGQFARAHVADVMQPQLVRMRRRLIGEAERFPELASTWYQNGPARGHQTLADIFSKLAERGLLQMDDPALAAEHFNWLILSIPLNRAMFYASEIIDTASYDYYADAAVRVFLAAYGRAGAAPGVRSRS
ncbi:MAG: TetR/AcrR family transcriptional regulator [Sphingorhabdus sp.]|uniref:TetR/AcrR family transcriptional regulator n=1 Tax=Sphingorhabdus sp. TaxID=1902408 RepID=UPI0032B938BF